MVVVALLCGLNLVCDIRDRCMLTLLAQHRILDRAAGLNEPYGLALNADSTALYTFSDDAKAVFKLDFKGRLSVSKSSFIGVDDLEGIAITSDGRSSLLVQDGANAILLVDLDSRHEVSRRPFVGMANYNNIRDYFTDPTDNNGLEGITVNTRNNHVFVVKEGPPGFLIEFDADLQTVLNAGALSLENGFDHTSVGAKKFDFPGLSYDGIHDTIWIISDEGQFLFHYDWNSDRFLPVIYLTTGNGG